MKLAASKKTPLIAAALLLCGLAFYFVAAAPGRNQAQAVIEEHRQAAGGYMQEQDYAAAAKELREVVRLQPDDADAQLQLGTTLYKGNQKREAAEVFKKLAQRDDYAGEAARKFLRDRLHVKS